MRAYWPRNSNDLYTGVDIVRYTTYHANFTRRDVREMDLKTSGGVTYRWFTGPFTSPSSALFC